MNATLDPVPRGDAGGDPARRGPLIRALRSFVDQSVWANREWTEFVYSRPDPEVRPRELLAHIMLGERVWFERIDGDPRTTATFVVLSEAELLRGFAENEETFRRLIDARLDDDVPFRRASGIEYHARVLDIVQHLLTHGYHHRGQLAAHYARVGVDYPGADHIDYLVEHEL